MAAAHSTTTSSSSPATMIPTPPTSSNRYCFDVAQFADDAFDPATFVTAAKEGASLEVLREHLRGYQRDLREELYEVINRDLADYLKLSSKLSGVESEVLEIRAPLQELVGGLQEAQGFVTDKRQALHDRLAERARVKARKATLQRRIRFLHTLGDLEVTLNMPGAPSSGGNAGRRRSRPLRDLGEAGQGTASTAMDAAATAAHCGDLERLAHAWLSLAADLAAFPATEQQGEDDVPTAGALGLRLQRAEKALLAHLAAAFRAVVCPRSLVVAVAGAGAGAGGSEEDKCGQKATDEEPLPVNEAALRHCLRAFLVLGRGDEAERQAARLVMLPFIDLNFTQGRLDGGARGSCAGLPAIYRACLAHARRHLGAALALAEDMTGGMTGQGQSQGQGLDLVGNGVWRPVHQALCARLGPAVFAPGIADILHGNYTVSMRFLARLAALAGPAHEAAVRRRLKAHPCTRDFGARWNLPVYFHLRFTEVAAQVDQALQLPAPSPSQAAASAMTSSQAPDDPRFAQPAFATVWQALLGLWAPRVFLPPLTPRLFKLTLQIVGRFHHWLDDALTAAKTAAGASASAVASAASSAPLLLPPERPEALVAVAWDALAFSGPAATQRLAAAIQQAVAAAAAAEEEGAGCGKQQQQQQQAEEMGRLVAEGLAEAMAPFGEVVARAWAALHERLVGQCAAALEVGVKGITATYRMTNKRPPERACPYLGRVLEPLRALEPEVKGRVPPELAPVWRQRVAAAVTERFLVLTQELLSSVQQMEDALKKRKQRAKGGSTAGMAAVEGAGGGSGAGAGPLSDSEKIQLQLLLDVAAFAQEMGTAAGLTNPVKECAPYAQLLRAVAPARLLLGRPDVQAALPPAIDAFLAASSTVE